MAKRKKAPDTTGDIPPWFMTYSDVVTLLMTFFILLMTFSTHSPEKTEKSRVTFFQSAGGTGLVGSKANRPAADSFVNRIRTRSARIAMRGSEMPPLTNDPSMESVGEGIRALSENEAKQDDMSTHYVDIQISELIDFQNRLTARGHLMAEMLAKQLSGLPVHCSLQVSSTTNNERALQFAQHLFDVEKVRPGQVAVSFVEGSLQPDSLRMLVERFNEGSK